ncbi:hypothetical protein NKH77_32535 [Streptomyces sp. M19]
MDQRRAELAAQRLRERRRPRPADPAASGPADRPSARQDAAPPRPRPPRTQRAAARWWSRPTTRSGSTSSASADPVRARAGSPCPYRCPPTSRPRSPPGHRQRRPRRPRHLELGPLQRRGAHRGTGPGARIPPARAPRPRERDRGRTPLFDQYADEDRPRAANE